MRKLIASIALGLALLTVPAISTGCQTRQTPEMVAYKTLMSTVLTVNAAEDAYAVAYNNHEVPDTMHSRVYDLDQKFRTAMNAAITAAEFDWSAPPSADIAALATELILEIERATQ